MIHHNTYVRRTVNKKIDLVNKRGLQLSERVFTVSAPLYVLLVYREGGGQDSGSEEELSYQLLCPLFVLEG